MKHICSICGNEFEFEYKPGDKLPLNFPFCSKRCKLIDLGRWLNEEYKISIPLGNIREMSEEELDELVESLIESEEIDFIENE